MISSSFLLPQRAGSSGFQLCSMGMQINVSARMVPIHHSITMTPMILVAIRNPGVMKMRWNSINKEILVNMRAVHWSVPTVYQSYQKNQIMSRVEVKVVAKNIYLFESYSLFWRQRPQMPSQSIIPNPYGSFSIHLARRSELQRLPMQINTVCAVVITYSRHTSISI